MLDNKGNGATVTTAQGYLNSALAALRELQPHLPEPSPDHQDFVTANVIPTTTTTQVPEPGSLALIAIALIAAGFVRARNARAAA